MVVLGGIELEAPPGLEDGDGGGLSEVTGEVIVALAVVDALDEAKVNDVLAGVSRGALRAKVSDCEVVESDLEIITFFRPFWREPSGICR